MVVSRSPEVVRLGEPRAPPPPVAPPLRCALLPTRVTPDRVRTSPSLWDRPRSLGPNPLSLWDRPRSLGPNPLSLWERAGVRARSEARLLPGACEALTPSRR